MKKFNNAIKRSNTDETQKTIFGKLKSFFGLKTKKKKKKTNSACKVSNLPEKTQKRAIKNKDKPRLKKFNYGIKRPKNEVEEPIKSLRVYIKGKWKQVIFLFLAYITILGAIVSTPIAINHLRNRSQNKTRQERSII